jgi:hypothetical protein
VRSFSRNKRGIAGSLIWINFDRHQLLNLVNQMKGTFIANIDDIRPQFRSDDNVFLSQNAIFQSSLVRANGVVAQMTIDQLNTPLDTRCFAVESKTRHARARESASVLSDVAAGLRYAPRSREIELGEG